MIKVHFHSECAFFAGCENMLANFFNSVDFRKAHSVSFSYVQSIPYTQGFQRRVNTCLPVYPVHFINFSDVNILPDWLPMLSRRMLMAILRLIFNMPLLAYQVYVLYFLLKKIEPDILHVNNGGYPAARSALAATIAGKLAGVPKVLMVVNNMAVDYRHYSRWLDYPIDRLVRRCTDVFITGSIAASERLKRVLDLPAGKVQPIHNGISLRDTTCTIKETLQRFGLADYEGIVFGVVALLIPRKGHQVLLEAVLKLVSEKKMLGHEFKILIEGEGPLLNHLMDYAITNHLTRWVTFVGKEDNIVDFMDALDVLILPSVSDEDFPNVVLEAMALGKPVIASNLAGTPEQIDDSVTGFLVEPRNVDQLSDAIYKLLNNASLRRSMGMAALSRFANKFNCQFALSEYSNLYKKLIEGFYDCHERSI